MPTVMGIRDGSVSAEKTLEKKGGALVPKKTFELTYIVYGDDMDTTEEDILATPGVPTHFYPLRGAWCKSVKPREIGTITNPFTGSLCCQWEVDCRFDSTIDSEDDQPPEGKRPAVKWDYRFLEEVMEEDLDGEAIVNTAGEPLPLVQEHVVQILTITRKEIGSFDPTVSRQYGNKVNSTPFWGFPEKTARMLPITAGEEEIIDGIRYTPVTYVIEFLYVAGRDEPWNARLLNYGTLARPAAGQPPARVVDGKGDEISRVLLAADGTRLPDGNQPHYLSFRKHGTTNLNALSLGPFE